MPASPQRTATNNTHYPARASDQHDGASAFDDHRIGAGDALEFVGSIASVGMDSNSDHELAVAHADSDHVHIRVLACVPEDVLDGRVCLLDLLPRPVAVLNTPASLTRQPITERRDVPIEVRGEKHDERAMIHEQATELIGNGLSVTFELALHVRRHASIVVYAHAGFHALAAFKQQTRSHGPRLSAFSHDVWLMRTRGVVSNVSAQLPMAPPDQEGEPWRVSARLTSPPLSRQVLVTFLVTLTRCSSMCPVPHSHRRPGQASGTAGPPTSDCRAGQSAFNASARDG